MISLSKPLLLALLALCLAQTESPSAEPPVVAYYFDELGQRYLTLHSGASGGPVEVKVRWAVDPGSRAVWTGQGTRKDNQVVFAALVDEGQDRGAYFIAKGGESKMEISFKPDQKMPQDPGILGLYRRVSEEKRVQLARKEFQAADDRLALALKTASRSWTGEDKTLAADWKARWPAFMNRWMKIAYKAPEPVKPKTPQPFATGKEQALPEKDANYWLTLADVTALGYSFMQQPPDAKSAGAWSGDYDDGFGGRVSIRQVKDGKLRVNLSCARMGELVAGDLAGDVPGEALKSKNGENSAEAVFVETEVPEASKEVRVSLKRKGGFLWLETQRKQAVAGSLAWFDGIYRWMPVPKE